MAPAYSRQLWFLKDNEEYAFNGVMFSAFHMQFYVVCKLSVYLQNGLFSAIPFIFFWAFINVGGFVADYLRIRGWKTKTVRKLMLSLGRFECSNLSFDFPRCI